MEKRIIIAVIPTYHPRNGGLISSRVVNTPDMKLILNICKDKNCAVTYPTTSLEQMIKALHLEERLKPQGDLYGIKGLEEEIHEMLEEVTDHIGMTTDFWTNITIGSKRGWQVFDYSNNLIEAAELEISSMKETSQVMKWKNVEKALYHQFFNRALFFYEEMKAKNVEVIVTEFMTAHCLFKLKPDEFEIFNDFPESFPVDKVFEDFEQVFESYKIFEQWDQTQTPLLTGNWDVRNPEKGEFQMYLVSPPKLGEVKGIISDKNGLATFVGNLGRWNFDFIKRHMQGSISENPLIDGRPIFYSLWLNSHEGEFHWKNQKGEEIHKQSCLVDLPINWDKLGIPLDL